MARHQTYQLLTQNEVEMIHETSLDLLEKSGFAFIYEPSLEILKKHGCKVDGKKVYMPRKLVEDTMKLCPSSFNIYSRNPSKTYEISTDSITYVGPVCPAFISDMDNGRRASTFEDFKNLTKLIQMLEHIDMHSQTSCEPGDLPVDSRYLHMCYEMLKLSDKPIGGTGLGYEKAKRNIEMAALAFGGVDEIRKRPVMHTCVSSLTPMAFSTVGLGAVHAYAEYGQPLMVSSLGIAGATSPCTIAGTMAVQNAEVLAGTVLAQLINPGTPIIYGASSSNMDMGSTLLAIGTPECAIFSLANAQLAKYYNLPMRNSGALSDSKVVDGQSAYESMMNLMTAQMSGANFILHACGILEGYNCVSYEKMVLDNEMVGMVKRIAEGVTVNADTLAYDVIDEVGPQGEYLSHEHTFENFRSEFFFPKISNRANLNNWEMEGRTTSEERANKEYKRLLAEYEEPKLDPEVDKALKKYMEQYI